jgi:hypothetical protein
VSADAPSTVPSEAAPKISVDVTAGNFAGTWRNDVDSGKVKLSLKREGDVWTASMVFTYQETEIPAKVTSLKVHGSKVEVVAAWTIQESVGQSRMVGEQSGDKIEGTFESETTEGTSSGTWSVTRA